MKGYDHKTPTILVSLFCFSCLVLSRVAVSRRCRVSFILLLLFCLQVCCLLIAALLQSKPLACPRPPLSCLLLRHFLDVFLLLESCFTAFCLLPTFPHRCNVFPTAALLLGRTLGSKLLSTANPPTATFVQGKTLDSKLLSTANFVALLVRHYFTQGLRESHKVLGGAGPAVAQVRASCSSPVFAAPPGCLRSAVAARAPAAPAASPIARAVRRVSDRIPSVPSFPVSVSYTHLTLPTILLV